jgi:hypothetical protein
MASEPKIIFTGGGTDVLKTTGTSFPGLKITPAQLVNFTEPYVATVTYVVECRVTGGHELKARISRSNPGPYPMLDPTAVLTTNAKYELRSHICGYRIDPGEHELYLEFCVSGGTGYIRYRYFSIVYSSI